MPVKGPQTVPVPRDFIFSTLGIEDKYPWDEMPPLKVLFTLRENAAWTQEELGSRFSPPLSPGAITVIERSGHQKDAERLLTVLKPRLQELAEAGWLDPASFVINDDCYGKIAQACKVLRTSKGLTPKELDNEMIKADLASFQSAKFEEESQKTGLLKIRSLSGLISIAQRLCTFFNIEEKNIAGLSVVGSDGKPLVTAAGPYKGRG